jgi:hypothetical protein
LQIIALFAWTFPNCYIKNGWLGNCWIGLNECLTVLIPTDTIMAKLYMAYVGDVLLLHIIGSEGLTVNGPIPQ